MRVTQVQLWPVHRSRFKAVAVIVLDDVLKIDGIKLIEGPNGFFVDFPARELKGRCPGCQRSHPVSALFCPHCGWQLPNPGDSTSVAYVVHPVSNQLRKTITEAIVAEYLSRINPE